MAQQLHWYARDVEAYGRDTQHLTMIEHGAYALLLDHYYRTKGVVYANAVQLHRVCRALDQDERDAVEKVSAEFFVVDGGMLRNKRADVEIQKSFEISNKRAGAASARWGAAAICKVDANADTPTPTPTKERATLAQPYGFAAFWSAYPRKKSKGDALKAWLKLKPDPALQLAISAAIINAKRGPDWLKDGGQFIPYPASWLNARGWEDEASAEPQAAKEAYSL